MHPRTKKIILSAMFVLALLGFVDATFLTIKHLSGEVPPCVLQGCQVVTTSKYSEIANVPIALLGMINYFVIMLASVLGITTRKEIIKKFLAWYVSAGFIFSLYLISLQYFILGAWCVYCVASAIVSILLFILGTNLHRRDTITA
jgi:uncharacterized membrane protein